MVTDINELDLSKSYTYADYLTWQFDDMVELIKGKILRMGPAPSSRHQRISRGLGYQLESFLFKKKCEIFRAPFDVRFTHTKNDRQVTTVVQPDICVICDASKIDERGCVGAPDFIIEILSPHTSGKDAHEKFNLYEEFGVGEYWMVSPNDKTVDVFLLEEGRYMFKGKFVPADKIRVHTLPGLEIDLNDVFS